MGWLVSVEWVMSEGRGGGGKEVGCTRKADSAFLDWHFAQHYTFLEAIANGSLKMPSQAAFASLGGWRSCLHFVQEILGTMRNDQYNTCD